MWQQPAGAAPGTLQPHPSHQPAHAHAEGRAHGRAVQLVSAHRRMRQQLQLHAHSYHPDPATTPGLGEEGRQAKSDSQAPLNAHPGGWAQKSVQQGRPGGTGDGGDGDGDGGGGLGGPGGADGPQNA